MYFFVNNSLGVQKGHQVATSGQTGHVAPLTAVELLLILHKMEGTSVKPSIEAISLCLAEKQVFTFEGNVIKVKGSAC